MDYPDRVPGVQNFLDDHQNDSRDGDYAADSQDVDYVVEAHDCDGGDSGVVGDGDFPTGRGLHVEEVLAPDFAIMVLAPFAAIVELRVDSFDYFVVYHQSEIVHVVYPHNHANYAYPRNVVRYCFLNSFT